MIWVFSAFIAVGDRPLIAAFVAQKMKFGVSTMPCGVVSFPHLALEFGSRFMISKLKFGYIMTYE
jgi:hypothetical protein